MNPGSGSTSLTYLRELLALVHNSVRDSPLPVTLVTPAGLMTGNAVRPAVWLRALADQVRGLEVAERDPGAKEMLAGRLDGLSAQDSLAGDLTDSLDYGDPGPDTITDVYLVDAFVLPIEAAAGASPLYSAPACWQVPLDQVVGWTLGSTRDAETPQPEFPIFS